MDLAKAKILLDKINRLYKSMSLDEDNIASIEKDLMRDYVKQLYETFMAEETAAIPTSKPPVTSISKPKVQTDKERWKEAIATPPPRAIRKEEPVKTVTPPPVRERVATPPPPKPAESAPVYQAPTPKVPPPPPPVVESTPTYSAPPPTPVQRNTTTYGVHPEHEELFHISSSAKELSEKLSQSRITDLNNALGINERIFTVNELFGANNSLYRDVINDLNNLQSFEEAKAYLSSKIAEKYNWTHKNKRTKAKNFIKLVRRRYA